MRRAAATVLLGTFVLFALPGMVEVVESAAHFAVAGHSAHATDAEDPHDDAGDEHGCTGAVHLCGCCVSLPLCSTIAPVAPPTSAMACDAPSAVVDQVRSGFLREIDHPPTA